MLSSIRQLFLSPASKAKPVKKKKRASKLSAIEMLGTKNVRKANFKVLESEQRKKSSGSKNRNMKKKQQRDRRNLN